MSLATGIGSMPGGEPLGAEAENARAYTEAVRIVLGELPDLPYVPELPGRGAVATMTGRALAVMAELGADLQPAGWRLIGTAGRDQRRARSLLAQDLDTVEELAQDFTGTFKTQVAGPWTLAATVEKPRGDKVLSDHGARRELAQALAEGVATHVADLRRRLPHAARLVVQVDEPALPHVLGGRVPTASGWATHRSVDLPEASALLSEVLSAVDAAGAEPWVHSCAADTPWDLIRGAGARGLLVDLSQIDAQSTDLLAEHLEAGGVVGFGVLPSTDPEENPTDRTTADRVLRWCDMVGLDLDELADQVVVTPTCGLAGASPAWARGALEIAAGTARNLS